MEKNVKVDTEGENENKTTIYLLECTNLNRKDQHVSVCRVLEYKGWVPPGREICISQGVPTRIMGKN